MKKRGERVDAAGKRGGVDEGVGECRDERRKERQRRGEEDGMNGKGGEGKNMRFRRQEGRRECYGGKREKSWAENSEEREGK